MTIMTTYVAALRHAAGTMQQTMFLSHTQVYDSSCALNEQQNQHRAAHTNNGCEKQGQEYMERHTGKPI